APPAAPTRGGVTGRRARRAGGRRGRGVLSRSHRIAELPGRALADRTAAAPHHGAVLPRRPGTEALLPRVGELSGERVARPGELVEPAPGQGVQVREPVRPSGRRSRSTRSCPVGLRARALPARPPTTRSGPHALPSPRRPRRLAPTARGPLSEAVLEAMRSGETAGVAELPSPEDADDAQLTLWCLYELHHRGF